MTNIGIIAGNGSLPFEVAVMLTSRDYHCHIYGIKGEVSSQITDYPHTLISLGQLDRLVKSLKREDIVDVLLLGGIRYRPTLWQLKPDLGLFRILPTILRMLSMGDNNILLHCINWFEGKGFRVCKLSDVAPELLLGEHESFGKKPSSDNLRQLSHGLSLLHTIGKYDIGQSAVVVGDRVVAIEGIEGTDSMLQRVRDLKSEGRLPKRGGVLVKCRKVGQDERVDLPTIGPQTIHNIHEAGLSGIGAESGHTIIIDRQETISLVKKYKLFIYGLSADVE